MRARKAGSTWMLRLSTVTEKRMSEIYAILIKVHPLRTQVYTRQSASKTEMCGVNKAIANSLIVITSWMAISIFTPISAKLPLAETVAQQQMQVVRYSNTWAVEVRGGAEEADALAQKHGLINRGQVKTYCLYTTDLESDFLLCRLVINNTTTCSWKGRLRGW